MAKWNSLLLNIGKKRFNDLPAGISLTEHCKHWRLRMIFREKDVSNDEDVKKQSFCMCCCLASTSIHGGFCNFPF